MLWSKSLKPTPGSHNRHESLANVRFSFTVLDDYYVIYQLAADSDIPGGINNPNFFSVTRTTDEISIICRQSTVISFAYLETETNWRIVKINGSLAFNMVGVLAHVSGILADANISVFTISTFATDYFLLKQENLDKALTLLKSHGHTITP